MVQVDEGGVPAARHGALPAVPANHLAPGSWRDALPCTCAGLLPAHLVVIEGELFGILMFTLGGLLWLLVPFIDRGTPDGRQSRWLFWLGLIVVIYIAAFTFKGYFL